MCQQCLDTRAMILGGLQQWCQQQRLACRYSASGDRLVVYGPDTALYPQLELLVRSRTPLPTGDNYLWVLVRREQGDLEVHELAELELSDPGLLARLQRLWEEM